jgi:hypothetical protein
MSSSSSPRNGTFREALPMPILGLGYVASSSSAAIDASMNQGCQLDH